MVWTNTCPEIGYIIERSGVGWSERFYVDIPSVGVRHFGSDERARIFFSEEDAWKAVEDIDKEFGYHCYVTRRSDLYPPTGEVSRR